MKSSKIISSLLTVLPILAFSSWAQASDKVDIFSDEAVCLYFPGPAQTWANDPGDMGLNGGAKIYNSSISLESGEAEPRLGFHDYQKPDWLLGCGTGVWAGPAENYESAPLLLNESLCVPDPSLYAPAYDFDSIPFKDKSDGITSATISQSHANGDTLTIGANNGYYDNVLFADTGGPVYIEPGIYHINSVSFNSNPKIVIKDGGTAYLFVKEFNGGFGGGLNVGVDGEVGRDLVDRLFLVVTGDVSVSSGAFTMNGYMAVQGDTILGGAASIYGGITTRNLGITGSGTVYRPLSEVGNCVAPPTQDPEFNINIIPDSAQTLTCKALKVTVEVTDDDGDPVDVSGTPVLVESSLPDSCWSTTEEGECTAGDTMIAPEFPDESGTIDLWLTSDNIGDGQVSATMTKALDGKDYTVSDTSGTYRFVPYQFEITNDQATNGYIPLIAGKPADVTITAMGDAGGSCEVITSYDSDNTDTSTISTELEVSDTDYETPSTGTEAIEIPTDLTSLKFKEGVANISLIYPDAGRASITVSDPLWQPTVCESGDGDGAESEDGEDSGETGGDGEFDNCFETDQTGDWTGLSGLINVESRPYTFALCDIATLNGNTNHSGTAYSGDAFARAGELFSVNVFPIRWTKNLDQASGSGYSIDGSLDGALDVETTEDNWCDSSLITPNYYQSNGLDAPVTISIPAIEPAVSGDPQTGAHTPINGAPGVIRSPILMNTPVTKIESGFTSANKPINGLPVYLSWSEVGSMWLQASNTEYDLAKQLTNYSNCSSPTLSVTGAEETCSEDWYLQGVAKIGRFYPDHFSFVGKFENAMIGSDSGADFTYMDQPFPIGLRLVALSEHNDETSNYDDFYSTDDESTNLLAKVGITIINDVTDDDSIDSRVNVGFLNSVNWDGGIFSTGLDNENEPDLDNTVLTQFYREDDPNNNSLQEATIPDGPYKAKLEVTIDSADCNSDPDSCLLEEAIFKTDTITDDDILDARYGVMTLNNTPPGGDVPLYAPVNVATPVQVNVEYYRNDSWGPSVINPNEDDDESKFNGAYYCYEKTGASFNGADVVVKGNSANLSVQGSLEHQQRLWLHIGSDDPVENTDNPVIECSTNYIYQPWLRYNWRGEGDEDPSIFATFSDKVIYRGNDRIIFRGEPGNF